MVVVSQKSMYVYNKNKSSNFYATPRDFGTTSLRSRWSGLRLSIGGLSWRNWERAVLDSGIDPLGMLGVPDEPACIPPSNGGFGNVDHIL